MDAPVEKLLSLLSNFQNHRISAQTFCTEYEEVWNFELLRNTLPEAQYSILNSLFDEVIYFIPLPKSEWDYPKYRTEGEILQAAEKALLSLQQGGFTTNAQHPPQ